MGLFLPANATFRRLTFGDFVTVKRTPPAAGTTAIAAQTKVGHQVRPNHLNFDRSKFLKGGKKGVFTMREDPNVVVVLQSGQPSMFVADWVFTRPQQFQDDLLNHEQGHYEIGMLNAKDFFFELQRIQATPFASASDGKAAVINLQATLGSAQAIHDKYDADTSSGLNPKRQALWDAALSAARITFVAPSLRVALKNAALFP
jgi:hypothetical protein